MKLSPLQLKHYHFTGISILARPGVVPEESAVDSESYPVFGPDELSTNVSLGLPEEDVDPHEFAVLLVISCEPSEESKFPYVFAVSLEGVFSIKHDGELEERKKLVVCNGASMLYGAAREVLLSLTARQKHGPMLLPSANFNGMGPVETVPNNDEQPKKEIKRKKPKIK